MSSQEHLSDSGDGCKYTIFEVFANGEYKADREITIKTSDTGRGDNDGLLFGTIKKTQISLSLRRRDICDWYLPIEN